MRTELYYPPDMPGVAVMRPVVDPNETEPTPEVKKFEITNIREDAQQILTFLADQAFQYGQNQTVRDFAISLISTINRSNDMQAQLEAVLSFMLNNVVYVRDPNGLEYVVSPIQMIRAFCNHGKVDGDCDDHTLLFNSLLNSLGFETRMFAVKINDSEYYNHVISSAKIGSTWYDFDTCAKAAPTIQYQGEKLMALS